MRHEKIDGVSHVYIEEGEDEHQVLRAIVKASFMLAQPVGMGWINFSKEHQMTDDVADRFITKCDHIVIEMDYVGGRQCKTYLQKIEDGHFTLLNRTYERDRGLPEPLFEKANEILKGKEGEKPVSTSDMYKGDSLTLRLKEYGFTRREGESDWEFRQRIFPDLYQKSPDQAMEFLMGASATEWNDLDKMLCLNFMTEKTKDQSRLKWFAEGFAADPIVMRERCRA